MRLFEYESRRFENGNINIRFAPDEIANIENGKYSIIECFEWKLEQVDAGICGDEFCLSNYEMGCYAYCDYNGMAYIVRFSELDKLLEGKTVKLFAFEPNDDELKAMGVKEDAV